MIGSSAVTRPLAGRWTSMRVAAAHVDVGLAVGDDQDLLAAQVGAQDRAQRLRRPGDLALVARPVAGLELAHQRAQVAGERPQLGHRDAGRGPHEPLAAQQRLHALRPSRAS